MNRSLYMAAEHLTEASKHLIYFDEGLSTRYMLEADLILSILNIEEEKISQERLDEVLNEILSVDLE